MNPSMTNKGSFPKLNELPPRMRIVAVAPGCPELWLTTTPATAPCSRLSKEEVDRVSSSFGTVATEPVTSLLRCVP